ncbi:molybdenum cofactor biosynthesis protein MoaE [Paenibacillus macquariensis]|uniref:Molybdopterin synthase catalytic subunit n=1 Tax=Paenibacillus macquariensis TaxID=948756 RepID=A0ABY1JX09_9BACL|nr:molybdenum cofactor biosynthesis protein MoaE [Paenibacillus macquariensis]MEC0089392.1 molybdenum cofactor biosynthesis protein MoaE [Paenibacillus macquariensis]OAB33220.1 molybdopterin converting factor [Paenibacillus macquariensis subsp. macquariensis]SIQ92283.1 molybdopterin synthase catalytic subunit [Paenibacillus macquariensis]
MIIKIRLFAGLAELLNTTVLDFSIDQLPISVDQLKVSLSSAYPEASSQISVSFFAINEEYATGEMMITEDDEVALIPPVSGGDGHKSLIERSSDGMYVITDEPLSIEEVYSKVLNNNHGATLSFVGTTREMTGDKRTVHLEYEAYIPMALSYLEKIGTELNIRWPGTICAISHRIGKVDIKEVSVIIAISSAHRDICYEASRYAIENLKQSVPIWKKEIWDDGHTWKGVDQQESWDPLSR